MSVVCTTYNHEKYIRQTLDGFIIQKTSFPIEIIVHDDASTDSTALII
ncbi:glycosyl transferase 2 family protein, partial [Bacteroides fragilis str. 3774 T13]